MFKHPWLLKKTGSSPRERDETAASALTLFIVAGVLLGGAVFIVNYRGIGFGSTPGMAPIAPFIGITMFAVLILMITDNQKSQARYRTSIISVIITGLAVIAALVMPG